MNNIVKKLLIIIASVIGGAYILFLVLPFILIPFINSSVGNLSSEAEKATGFKIELKDLRLITTPKLTVGLKFDNLKIYQPDKKLLLNGDNFKVKMSLIPLLAKKIEVDVVSADNFALDLYVKNDGHFLLEDLIKTEDNSKSNTGSNSEDASLSLPFGLQLSNHLPDIRLKKHNIAFVDCSSLKRYELIGSDTNITDFIINKEIKVQSKGKLVLDGYEAFLYNTKVFNKIMPEIDLNKLISGEYEQAEQNKTAQNVDFNILEALKLIKSNGVYANLDTDITIDGNAENVEVSGKLNLDKLSMLINGSKLPESNLNIKFNKTKYDISSNLNTSKTENTKITGLIKTGKNPLINLDCKSNTTLGSIFNIVKTFASIAGIKDLQTLSGSGQFDVNFNIKSDLKKLASNGYVKLTGGLVNYGLYGVKIENLISDIKLDNNNLLINKLGFSTMGIPLNITGKILQDATCDIKINTTSLPIKGLLISLGQAALLKENPVYSGSVSISANVKDKLIEPKITGNVVVNNLKLKNTPSDIMLSVNPININLNSVKTGFKGTISAANIKAANPTVDVIVPSLSASVDEKNIVISDTKTQIAKNSAVISGTISNYLTEKIGLDFVSKGQIAANLNGHVNPNKMTMDVKFALPSDSVIIIPGFDKSKLTANGSVNISGSIANPILKGQFNVPNIEIPEVPLSMKNTVANINGPVLNGSASVGEFVTGGIKAINIKTDYRMHGADFYLNNLTGSAFDGSFNGNIIYNMSNLMTKVKFKGKDMDALKAIEGAAGIKNALTGTLAFDADVSLKAADYDVMMKTLKGSATFDIKKGYLGNLGSLDKLLLAQNIAKYTVLKAAGQSASNNSAVKNASKFDYIKGKLTFANAYATLAPVELSGSSMACYIAGKYQLLNGTVNVIVLGRLSNTVVSALGNIGSLAASKISNSIPALGTLTSIIVQSMNISPSQVDTSKIPALSSASESKLFKVEIAGGVESASSVKSFKWINDVDTSDLDATTKTITETAATVKNQINQARNTVKDAVTNVKSVTKEQVKEQAKEQGKALLRSLLTPPASSSSQP